MKTITNLPLFPLGILPIPLELVPLHIFERRYRQLLQHVQNEDEPVFGILFDHPLNKDKIGTIVKLESILKKYDTGESDIVVQGVTNFILSEYWSKRDDKLYPSGEVIDLENDENIKASPELLKYFRKYLKERDDKEHNKRFGLHEIANMLHMEVNDRISYIKSSGSGRSENFLHRLIKYHMFLLEQESKSRSNFYLN